LSGCFSFDVGQGNPGHARNNRGSSQSACQEHYNQDDHDNATDSKAACWAVRIIATATSKEQKKNQNY
jgi:hypothetical protein